MSGRPYAAEKERNARLLLEDVERRATVFRAAPDVIGLHTTEVCNLKCVQCPRSVSPGTEVLPRAELARVCETLFPTARKAILTAAAGEPLLRDFDLVLERALECGVRLDVITNGTVLTESLYAAASPALDHLNVSLDSLDPEGYRRIRGAPLSRVTDHLEAIRDRRAADPDDVLLTVSAVVMRSNLDHLADFVRAAGALGVDGVLFQRLLHQVKASRDEDPFLAPGEATVRAAFDDARRAALETGTNIYLGEFGLESAVVRPLRDKRPATIEGKGLCWFLAQEFAVMYTGDVYPCCFVTDHLLGNLRREDPLAIWNGRPAQRLRAAHWSRRGTLFCRGCVHAPHLPPQPETPLVRAARLARRAWVHAKGKLTRGRARVRQRPGLPNGEARRRPKE